MKVIWFFTIMCPAVYISVCNNKNAIYLYTMYVRVWGCVCVCVGMSAGQSRSGFMSGGRAAWTGDWGPGGVQRGHWHGDAQ